jgi:hypothetical protein
VSEMVVAGHLEQQALLCDDVGGGLKLGEITLASVRVWHAGAVSHVHFFGWQQVAPPSQVPLEMT